MSAGDFAACAASGVIEISPSLNAGAACSGERVAARAGATDVASRGVTAAGAAAGPSWNIGFDGSSWRPSVTALCQTSPCPWLTAKSSEATVSNACGLLCCEWISSSFR
jgi:hypothetical protein